MLRFHLRTKIAFTICVLVVVATLLIDFVFIVTLQKKRVHEEISRARSTLAALPKDTAMRSVRNRMAVLGWLRNAAGADSLAVVSADWGEAVSGEREDIAPLLLQMAKMAGKAHRHDVAFHGQTWGVFWRQHRYVLVAMPIGQGGGAAMGISLESVYRGLRNVQQVIFIYLFINGVLLTLLGVMRVSQVAVKPVERLLKRAEGFRDDGPILFVADRSDNEFSQLSRALNRMLERISEDREKLRENVRSLERSNIDLKKAQNDIIQAEKLASVGRLSSGIAHEIGNPIGIVLGYLELLQQTEISEAERSEYIRRAQEEINRIGTILRQLLDFSRPSKGDAETVSVHGVLTDILEIVKVQPLMEHVSVRLELEAQNDAVHADANRLRQVFLNLVINAADAVSLLPPTESGQLTIGSEILEAGGQDEASGRAMLKLRFADNGPGIAEEHMGNVFDPFFTTKAPGKGTGLGLSVCFMIVEQMGGRIFAESQESGGTVITLYLPLVDGDTQ